MRQHKTIAQTLFILSILNLVYAAPVVSQEAHDAVDDVAAEDVTRVSSRRRGVLSLGPGESTSSQYPSSFPPPDGSSTPHSSAIDGVPLRDSTVEPSTPAHPLPTTGGPAPVPDPNTGASTSPHPESSLETDGAVPALKFYQRPIVKKVAGITAIGTIIAGLIILASMQNRKEEV